MAFGLDDLFSLGSSLLGGIMNNKAAERRQEDAQEFSAQQYATRYQTSVKDIAAAGLNPALAYGGISGNPPTSSAASSAGIPDLGGSLNQSKAVSSQRSLQTAQIANIEADTANKAAQAKVLESEAARNWASADQASAMTGQIGATVQRILAEIPLLKENTLNANEQGRVIRQMVEQVKAQTELYREQGMSQEAVRAQLQALAGKLAAETNLTNLDIDAALKMENVGRELGQLKPFFDIFSSILRSTRR